MTIPTPALETPNGATGSATGREEYYINNQAKSLAQRAENGMTSNNVAHCHSLESMDSEDEHSTSKAWPLMFLVIFLFQKH